MEYSSVKYDETKKKQRINAGQETGVQTAGSIPEGPTPADLPGKNMPQSNMAPGAVIQQRMRDEQSTPKTSPEGRMQTYDPISDAAYQRALAALQVAESRAPTYEGSYDAQLLDVYNKIVGRDQFSYDINSDMLYQQYRDQYANMGQLAMKDTMGQAAALTGGYGSTYGQAVGQQQYDAYLQKLNAVVPELYGMARDQYNREGDELIKQHALLQDKANDEYSKYADEYKRWLAERQYLQGQAEDAYQRGYGEWKNEYTIQQNNRENLLYLIKASGYDPTDDELSAAGMTRQQADSLRQRYFLENGLPVPGATGGGAGSAGGPGGGGTPNSAIPKDKTYKDGKTASQVATDAASYFMAHPNVQVDSMTIDYWLMEHGYSGESAAAFKARLLSLGATTSDRGRPNKVATKVANNTDQNKRDAKIQAASPIKATRAYMNKKNISAR